jgi:Recombination endonuclease VII
MSTSKSHPSKTSQSKRAKVSTLNTTRRKKINKLTPADRHNRKFFNLAPGEKAKILEFQGNVCAITKRRYRRDGLPLQLSVDHCHDTGRIRGILSHDVNKGLAFFDDDPTLLRAAAAYLEENPATSALGEEVYGVLGRTYKRVTKNLRYGPDGTKQPQHRAVFDDEGQEYTA